MTRSSKLIKGPLSSWILSSASRAVLRILVAKSSASAVSALARSSSCFLVLIPDLELSSEMKPIS